MNKTNSLVIIFSLSLFASGCMTISAHSGKQIEMEQLNKIQPGNTSKNEVFAWIGPPMAVMATGELIPVPTPFIWKGVARSSIRPPIQSDTFFELFSSKNQINEYHRVYYFYHAVSRKTAFTPVAGMIETITTKFDKLWLLVNEKTGIVEDYKFKLTNT